MKKRRSIMPDGVGRKFCSVVMAAALALSLVNVTSGEAAQAAGKSGVSLENPRIVEDSDYKAGQRVTYDCVYFGSYPQAEVVASEADETTVAEVIRAGSDYVVDEVLYKELCSKTDWDANGDTTIDGEKYRRINYKNAMIWDEYSDDSYNWGKAEDGESVSTGYHYFKYQPIKWRVLAVDGSTAFLLADVALDCQMYASATDAMGTWETSVIRSFLNSYSEADNQSGVDYSGSGFLANAFTAEEILAIEKTTVVNDYNIPYATESGHNTVDRIFTLSEQEVYGDSSAEYGFATGDNICDEARTAKTSTYAKAMGCFSSTYVDEDSNTSYVGNCWWWLRSPGGTSISDRNVFNYSWQGENGIYHYFNYIGVRPALKFNLSSVDILTSAGTYTTETMSSVPDDKDDSQVHIHSYIGEVTQEATCVSEGVMTYTCISGDDSYTEPIAKDKNNHVGYTSKVTRAATCTREGVRTYTCACGAKYTKAIGKKAHTNTDWIVTKKASAKADGQKIVKCTTCGAVLLTEKVIRAGSVSFSASKYAYDGKAKTPAVMVRDAAGMDISAFEYSVSYKNNKKPGTATVTVTFKGSTYTGTLKGKFTISKGKQTIKTAKVKAYKASALKKKKATISLSAKTTGNGKLTYKVSKYPKNAKKYISVSKKGIVTLKKGAKKGTYKITITAAGTSTKAKATKTVTIKVK